MCIYFRIEILYQWMIGSILNTLDHISETILGLIQQKLFMGTMRDQSI